MTSVITSNNPFARDNVAPPPITREDGTNYPWRMFFDQGQRIADADTLDEMIDILIPGYLELETREEKLAARIRLGAFVQQLARGAILSPITPEDAEEIEDWEWDVLVYGNDESRDPFGWKDGTGTLGEFDADGIDVWSSKYPLVLLETSYTPFTEITPPLSSEGDFEYVKNLIWIRPSNEKDFLYSLSRIGFITFGTPAATIRDDKNAN